MSGKEVLLTAAGRSLYAFATTVLGAQRDLERELASHRADGTRVVRIAAASYYGPLVEATRRLRSENGSYSVEFRSENPPEAIGLVRSGEVHFAISGPVHVTEGLRFEQCAQNDMAIVAPRDHPLVGREVTLGEVAQFPMVAPVVGSGRAAFEAHLRDHPGITPTYVAHADNSTAVGRVSLALGVLGLVVRNVLAEDEIGHKLAELNVRDFTVSYPVYLAFLDESSLSEPPRLYRKHLRSIWMETNHQRSS